MKVARKHKEPLTRFAGIGLKLVVVFDVAAEEVVKGVMSNEYTGK